MLTQTLCAFGPVDEGYVEQMCTKFSGVGPIQSVGECARAQELLPRCLEMFQAECIDRSVQRLALVLDEPLADLPRALSSFDIPSCGNAVDFCSSFTIMAFARIQPRRNWYNIAEICSEEAGCVLVVPSRQVYKLSITDLRLCLQLLDRSAERRLGGLPQ